MPLWTLNNPPTFKTDAVATEKGWEHPDTGEVLVAIGTLTTKAGAADVLSVRFMDLTLAQGDDLAVEVRLNEKVDVTAGATLVVSWDGMSGDVTLHALAQTNTNVVVFNKDVTLLANAVVPSESGTLSIAAQTMGGTIKDAGTLTNSNKAISAPQASAADTIEVA